MPLLEPDAGRLADPTTLTKIVSSLGMSRSAGEATKVRSVPWRARIMLLRLQNTVLEMIAKGEPLTATIDRLCAEVELIAPGTICSVLTVDSSGLLHPLSGPSLPESFSNSFDGIAI